MVGTQDAELRELIHLAADELARVYDDARSQGGDFVILLVDRQDSLGRQICDQFEWKEDLNIQPLPREEVVQWLDGLPELAPLARQLVTAGEETPSAKSAAAANIELVSVLVVARESAYLELVSL